MTGSRGLFQHTSTSFGFRIRIKTRKIPSRETAARPILQAGAADTQRYGYTNVLYMCLPCDVQINSSHVSYMQLYLTQYVTRMCGEETLRKTGYQ